MFTLYKDLSILGNRPDNFVCHNDSNNNSEQTKCAAKDLNNQHANESWGSLSVSESSARTDAADWESTAQVTHSNNKSDSKNAVGRKLGSLPRSRCIKKTARSLQFVLQNDRDDNSVNSDCLTEDDRNQILWNYARHFYGRTNNADSSNEYAPKEDFSSILLLTTRLL